eukprot:CAMPEP_0176081492 /NCGR_PEP_ID=MMETSP0120_2-20121206/40764_1 /TAXON_ID=160619 /ORGANISM="Kryptoperidinium foliaceum, Strain CCMP 1326" /LENGTH=147 /DNA_ID=CAMNT_0017415261 /DNA_START=92 /DNA_END=532 /DNA_ORIENTATION=+
MEFQVIVKNTFLHATIVDEPTARRSSSVPPSCDRFADARACGAYREPLKSLADEKQGEASSASTSPASTTSASTSLASTSPVSMSNRKRLGKKRRLRFREMVDRLAERTLADPTFDISEAVPLSIRKTEVSVQKLVRIVERAAGASV